MRVLIATRDLFFRAKLGAVVQAAGGETTRDEAACHLAVIDVDAPDSMQRVVAWVARGIPVLAFGSHVKADALRAAREAGATAVPNAQVEQALAERIRG